MARVQSFRIRALAGRRGVVRHSLQPDVNVFFAQNGAGKTSLLKILHSALVGDGDLVARVPFEFAEVRIDSGDGMVVRTFDRGAGGNGHWDTVWDAEAESPVQVWVEEEPSWSTRPSSASKTQFKHGYLPISRISEGGMVSRRRAASLAGGAVGGVQGRATITEAAYDRQFAKEIEDRWRTYATEALIQIRTAQERGLAEVLDAVLNGPGRRRGTMSSVPAEEAFRLVREFFEAQPRLRLKVGGFQKFNERYQGDDSLRDIVQRVEQVQESINRAQQPQRRLEEVVRALFNDNKDLVFTAEGIGVHAGDGTVLPLESLSSGERQLLLLMLECLRLGENAVVIDEPELSMHIDWQRRLVNTLLTVGPSCQLVMATHSPEVMADLADRCVYEL